MTKIIAIGSHPHARVVTPALFIWLMMFVAWSCPRAASYVYATFLAVLTPYLPSSRSKSAIGLFTFGSTRLPVPSR